MILRKIVVERVTVVKFRVDNRGSDKQIAINKNYENEIMYCKHVRFYCKSEDSLQGKRNNEFNGFQQNYATSVYYSLMSMRSC